MLLRQPGSLCKGGKASFTTASCDVTFQKGGPVFKVISSIMECLHNPCKRSSKVPQLSDYLLYVHYLMCIIGICW